MIITHIFYTLFLYVEYNHLLSLMVLSIDLMEAKLLTEGHTNRLGAETLERGVLQ